MVTPRAAQALNGLTNPGSQEKSDFRKAIQWAGRQMASNFTSRNPAFMVTNFMRDSMFAGFTSSIKHGGRYTANFYLNMTKVWRGLGANIWSDGYSGVSRLYKRVLRERWRNWIYQPAER